MTPPPANENRPQQNHRSFNGQSYQQPPIITTGDYSTGFGGYGGNSPVMMSPHNGHHNHTMGLTPIYRPPSRASPSHFHHHQQQQFDQNMGYGGGPIPPNTGLDPASTGAFRKVALGDRQGKTEVVNCWTGRREE